MRLKIRQERILRGWTQEYMAKSVSVTRTQISDIENGISKPSYEVLVKLEDLFNMDHRELFAPACDEGNE